jgi:anti-sigma regulatory factor (Ser/Thr protein kinase)
VTPTGTWQGDAFAHEAFIFGADAEVVDRCVPFVQEGLARDEPVIVVATEVVRQALADALGADLARLSVIGAAETWWQGDGATTLSGYDQDLRRLLATGRPWRLIGEPVWLAREDGRTWSRYEAVANSCYATFPYYSLCLHDRRRLPPDVIDEVGRTHPLVWDGSAPAASPAYQDTGTYLRSVEPVWYPRPATATTTHITSALQARAVVRSAVPDGWGERRGDMILAVHELAANALRAAGVAELSSWVAGHELVWEVADAGPGFYDVTAGYVPPGEHLEGGRGLWLARGIADDVTIRGWGPGTAIRLYFRSP